MANKMDKEYFEQIDEASFYSFMNQMNQCCDAYAEMVRQLLDLFDKGQQPSWNAMYLIRQVSIDVQKFGKMFREKTIDAEKRRPFNWSEVYKRGKADGKKGEH